MRHKKNRGFTLVELIVTTAVSAILIAALFSYLLYNLRMYTIADNEAKIQEECTKIMERLTILGKESTGIDFIIDGDGIRTATFFGSNEQIKLNGNQLTIGAVNGEKMHQYIEISGFNIEPIGGSLYEIIIIGSRKTESKRFTTTISTRN